MAITKIGQVGSGSFNSSSRASGALDTTGADCILVSVYHDNAITGISDTDSDTYTLIGNIGLCSVYEAVGITDSNNKNVTVTQTSGVLIVNQIAYSGVDQTTPSYEVKTVNGNPAQNTVTPTDSADAIISAGAGMSISTYGTGQVLVINTNVFSAWFNVVTEELLAGTSADVQSMSGATTADMVSFALAAYTDIRRIFNIS